MVAIMRALVSDPAPVNPTQPRRPRRAHMPSHTTCPHGPHMRATSGQRKQGVPYATHRPVNADTSRKVPSASRKGRSAGPGSVYSMKHMRRPCSCDSNQGLSRVIFSLRVAPPGTVAPWHTFAAARPLSRTWHVPQRPFCDPAQRENGRDVSGWQSLSENARSLPCSRTSP